MLIHVVYIVWCRDIPSFVPGSKLANHMCPKNFIDLLTISPLTPNFMILKNVALKYLLVSQVFFSQHFGKRGVCMIVLLWHFVWPLTSQCDDQGSVISDPILKEKSLILSWGLAAPAQMPDSGPAWFPPWIEEYIISSSQINVSGNFELECKFKFQNLILVNWKFYLVYWVFVSRLSSSSAYFSINSLGVFCALATSRASTKPSNIFCSDCCIFLSEWSSLWLSLARKNLSVMSAQGWGFSVCEKHVAMQHWLQCGSGLIVEVWWDML